MSTSELLKVAVCCMNSLDDIGENLSLIERFSREASIAGAEIVFFPENALFMRVKEGSEVPFFTEGDPNLSAIQQFAKSHKINIHLGSVPFKIQNKVYNSTLLVTDLGNLQVLYSKIHLFDIQLQGQAPIRESDVFSKGNSGAVFEYKSWRFGQSICYDIRFSELYKKYADAAVDVILIPAAFLKKTGEAHWHVLNRARAIESQCYVISSAQGGVHKSRKFSGLERETFGHALVVDPWGNVEIDNNQPNSIQVFELSKEKIKTVRMQIPMAEHRRDSEMSETLKKISCVIK